MHTAVLIFFGSLIVGFVGVWLLYSLGTRDARNSLATPSHAFSRQVPDTAPGRSQRPKLAANGRVMVFFACPAGLVGLAISWATVHKLLEDRRYEQAPTATAAIVNPKRRASDAVRYQFEVAGQAFQGVTNDKTRAAKTITVHYLASNPASNRPVETPFPVTIALLPPVVFDVAFLWLVWKLRRDYVLVRRGRLTTGIVVGYAGNKAPGVQSLVTTFYDFLNAQGAVTRGHSILPNYTVRGPYYQTAVGSGVEVFYIPESPERNALKWSLSWEV
jgi:hypothetical protein